MCPGYDQSLQPRRSGSRKSWEVRNPFGHGGDSPDDQEQDADRQEEDDSGDEEGGSRVDDEDREEEEDKELVDVLGRCPRRRNSWGSDTGSSYFYDRQLYLHSYQFRRKISVCDRLKGGIKRIKAAAWSLVSCKFGEHRYYHHRRYSSARKLCKKLSGALSSSLSLKPRCIQVPD